MDKKSRTPQAAESIHAAREDCRMHQHSRCFALTTKPRILSHVSGTQGPVCKQTDNPPTHFAPFFYSRCLSTSALPHPIPTHPGVSLIGRGKGGGGKLFPWPHGCIFIHIYITMATATTPGTFGLPHVLPCCVLPSLLINSRNCTRHW